MSEATLTGHERDSQRALFATVQRFEEAWAGANPPSIADFLATTVTTGLMRPDLRLQLLQELAPIDLEHRWRRWGSDARKPVDYAAEPVHDLPRLPRLEDYLQRFPELGTAEELSVDMVTDEFWAHHHWGDCPSIDEYLRRFGKLCEQLKLSLSVVLAELAPVMLSVAYAMEPVHTHRFVEPLEIGRQRAGEPPPYCQVSSTSGRRLIIAAADEKQISRHHLLLARTDKRTVRVTSHTAKGDILLGSTRLAPGRSAMIEVPVLLVLGHYAIRLELV